MSNTNRIVQPQKMVRGLKFRNLEVEELYYLCSENKGAGQLRSPCSRSAPLFSHMLKAGFLMRQLISCSSKNLDIH